LVVENEGITIVWVEKGRGRRWKEIRKKKLR
jgi:hypothetical protein